MIFRLPTEAQWEYASQSDYDGYLVDIANFRSGGYSKRYAQTQNVGQYNANYLGFFDMFGNVSGDGRLALCL